MPGRTIPNIPHYRGSGDKELSDVLSKLKEAIVKYEKARSLGSEDRRLYAELSIVYDVSGHLIQMT